MRLLQHFGHNGSVRTLGTPVFGSGPATALRFNIKGYDQVAPPRGARESVPQGHLIVAHYEVVGKGVKDSSVPEGTIEPLSPWLAYGLASASSQSIVPCGTGRF